VAVVGQHLLLVLVDLVETDVLMVMTPQLRRLEQVVAELAALTVVV